MSKNEFWVSINREKIVKRHPIGPQTFQHQDDSVPNLKIPLDVSIPRLFGTKIFRLKMDGWMDGWNKIHVF